MFSSGPIIAQKQKGDRIIERLSCSEDDYRKLADWFVDQPEAIFCNVFEEDLDLKAWVEIGCNFRKIGIKINTFSDIIGIYYRESFSSICGRDIPVVHPAEKTALHQVYGFEFVKSPDPANYIQSSGMDFANHYSKYNSKDAWGAVALRGYSSDPAMIEKPEAMKQAWRDAHPDTKLQDTELMEIPEFWLLKEIIDTFPGEVERARLMRLTPGGGELKRHTDQVDPNVGTDDGKIMRFHFPIITNPAVLFTAWDYGGFRVEVNMEEMECWYLDMRKPHTAINNGSEDRIHFVIDVFANEDVRKLIV